MKTITYDEAKWKLVPVEPTNDMISAMQSSGWMIGNYKAMLSAAPVAPQASACNCAQIKYKDGFHSKNCPAAQTSAQAKDAISRWEAEEIEEAMKESK